ncbi:MAG: hypothetical protein D6800_13165, partial [Candidatus Zixiibacteriota bacterium]
RKPDDVTEIILADNAADGTSGVTISDDGGGVYTASVQWDPPDVQDTGLYDLYFHVSDGIDTAYDGFSNNLDELHVLDAVTNSPPTLVPGNTVVVPDTLNRIGSQFTMLKATFSDVDVPGNGAFTITFKVRDQSGTEYPIVSGATNGQQGLRVRHISGNTYEAAVLWDAPDAQATGPYDLYFSVQDNKGAVATDNYVDNTDELQVISAALAGDGNLLRRNNDAGTCGGPNSACHNLKNHQGQDCLTCHAPHATTNIYLIRDTIQTPNSGPKPVVFKTLGIGDPYNSPDPVPGDPNSGVMADSTNGVFTGICEVCHTTTAHHRNDGSEPPPNHHDAENCTTCHPHTGGFAAGESSGGNGCTCHQSILTPMKDSTSLSYHHLVLSDDANYDVYAKTCLRCHVHHDIFRPDLNPGVGQRAKNLRVDFSTPVVPGDNTVLSNSDYSATGSGGICLSCHSDATCSGCHSVHVAAGTSYNHEFLVKADYDAATATHNYNVPSTFASDGSVFNANCVKCHNDNRSKSYQNSAHTFSTHVSDFRKLLNPLGAAAPSDPLEEEFCFQCHSETSNPNAGSSKDYYGVQSMANSNALRIEAEFSYTYTHPTTSVNGVHIINETAANLGA